MNAQINTPPKDKAGLIQRIKAAHAELEESLGKLDPAALSRPGPDGGWSVLDHIIHLAEWRWKLLAMIEGRAGYEGLKIDPQTYQSAGIDGINAILYERNRGRPAAKVWSEFRQAHESVLAAIDRLSEADLRRAYDLTDPSDPRLLLEGIIDNTYGHDLEHLEWIREMRAG